MLPALLLFVAACLAVFGTPWTAGALAVLAALLLARRRLRRVGVAGWLVVAALRWWMPLFEYQDRVDALTAKLEAGGPSALSTRDLVGIWLLNVGMAAGGVAVGFPEVALETLLLAVPGADVRVFRSDFAMASPRVRAAVDALAPGGPPRRVTFTYADHTDARVGLALNPLDLTMRPGGEIVGRVRVSYPVRGRLPLFHARGRPIVIEEGLFHALQARGWLFPYVAEWHWRA